MNKKGILPEKTGYFIIFIFLFMIAFLYATSFLKTSKSEFNSEEIEDSIIATRILNCFSSEEFGIIDESKMNMVELRRCFDGDKYFLKVVLKKESGLPIELTPYGNLPQSRSVKRYVILENGNGVLEINYKKNLKRYEDAD